MRCDRRDATYRTLARIQNPRKTPTKTLFQPVLNMSNYFEFVGQELLSRLFQVKSYIKKHNPTIGILTEEIIRDFLRKHLPKIVSVDQGFILFEDGELSKQCDILIYDSHLFAPFYRINDVVIIPAESVLSIVEVKTTITRQIFHDAIDYFKSFDCLENAQTHLFIFNSKSIDDIRGYFESYKHVGDYQSFDHDTFQFLPDKITGLNSSYHLKKNYVITDRDMMGYDSCFYEDKQGTEINALELFYLSIHQRVEDHIKRSFKTSDSRSRRNYHDMKLKSIFAIELFYM